MEQRGGRGLNDLRLDNTHLILDLLRHYGPLTRRELCEMTDLTTPTVAAILDSLQRREWLSQDELRATGGRKARAYRLNAGVLHVAAIDVQVDRIRGAAVGIDGSIHGLLEWPSRYRDGAELFTVQLAEMADALAQAASRTGRPLLGVGISLPVFLDPDDGAVSFAPSIGGVGARVVEPLEKAFGLPVIAENDARACVFSEVWWNPKSAGKTVVFLVADYGVGSGIAIDGRLHRGMLGAAGDIGHAVIDPRGEPCRCGQRGCLETFVSYPKIRRLLEERRADLSGGDSIGDILAKAERGDAVTSSVLLEAAEYLAVAVNILGVLLAPDVVYLGGALGRSESLVFDRVFEAVRSSGPEPLRGRIDLRPATHGENAGIMGAAALAFAHIIGGSLPWKQSPSTTPASR